MLKAVTLPCGQWCMRARKLKGLTACPKLSKLLYCSSEVKIQTQIARRVKCKLNFKIILCFNHPRCSQHYFLWKPRKIIQYKKLLLALPSSFTCSAHVHFETKVRPTSKRLRPSYTGRVPKLWWPLLMASSRTRSGGQQDFRPGLLCFPLVAGCIENCIAK